MNVQYGKAAMVGIAMGLLGGIIASGFTIASFICCLANMVGYLGPALSGVIAAAASAGLQSTADTEKGKEVLQGVVSGVVGAGAAALTCAVIFGLMQFLYPVFMVVFGMLGAANSDEIMANVMAAGITAIWAAFIALMVGIGSGLGGLVGGAITGAIVGAIKGATRG